MITTNQRFGDLLVVGQRDISQPKAPRRLCKCTCGNRGLYREAELLKGLRQRCASCAKTGSRNPGWKGCGELNGWYWGVVLRGARKRNLKVTITIKDAWKKFLKQNRQCALSGVLLVIGAPGQCNGTASLDRIDSNKGYTQCNIQWVHKKINLMKLDLPQEEFLTFCRLITENKKQ